MDESKESVERWKLSPEMINIEREFRKRANISKILQEGIKLKANELNTMAQALYKSEQQQEMLSRLVPTERMEVEGTPAPEMETPGIESFEINY